MGRAPSADSLRVLHIITSTQRRGAESFAVGLCASLVDRGHGGRVVALQRASGPPEHDVPALGMGSFTAGTLGGIRRAGRWADVVIAHGSRTLPASVLALAGTDVPIVYVNIGDPLFWANTLARRARVRFLLRRVRAVAALTDSSRAVLIDRFGKRPEDVRVIPNGRHAADFPPADPARRVRARDDMELPQDSDVVLYLGALSPEKRPDVAIDAVARMDGGSRLVVAGDGSLREELQRRAHAALGERAVFLGARSDAARLLAAADVLVLPSDSEGLPGVVIEAGLVGIPVVATDVGFVRDVVLDGVTGRLTPPGDPSAMAHALGEALAQRDAMGRAGRAHCLAHFEMARIVDTWEALLRQVVARTAA